MLSVHRSAFPMAIVLVLQQSLVLTYPIPAENATELLDDLLIGYNKEIIPNKDGRPVNCTVKMTIRDMVPMDELPMHYTIDFVLQMVWYDYRLEYPQAPFEPVDFNPLNDSIALPLESSMVEKLWVPNIYFPYGKKSYAFGAVTETSMMLLKPNGEVVYNRRIALASFCAMDLVFYPFDIQDCKFHIESFSYSEEYFNLFWDAATPIAQESQKLHMREFSEVEMVTKHKTVLRNSQTYDSLVIELKLFRFLEFYFLRDYFPCILIVILSWISFWIDYRSTPARVALGITTVLTIVTLTNGIRANSPPEGLFRSLDYYLLVCNLFVFSALGEYALVGKTNAHYKRYKKLTPERKGKADEKNDVNGNGTSGVYNNETKHPPTVDERAGKPDAIPPISERVVALSNVAQPWEEHEEVTNPGGNRRPALDSRESGISRERGLSFVGENHIVDQFSKVLFPLSFMLFNGVYFLIHRLHPDTVD